MQEPIILNQFLFGFALIFIWINAALTISNIRQCVKHHNKIQGEMILITTLMSLCFIGGSVISILFLNYLPAFICCLIAAVPTVFVSVNLGQYDDQVNQHA